MRRANKAISYLSTVGVASAMALAFTVGRGFSGIAQVIGSVN